MEIESLTYKLLDDSWSIHMAIISIAISIITLLYSLAIGKREELKILSDADKFGCKDPIVDAKISASAKYIEMVKKAIFSCNLILTLSVINALFIIRKTKRFDIPERAVYFLKTKRTAGGTPPPQNIFDRLTPVFT